MATTTPNFGWAVPTSTDLVKDGAVAIETLGDAIDASLVDLKGGTSGQVLKKNSNTDMDFIWSADSAGMTNPMTTTGDTIYSSSGSTPARLGIGSTGQVLTVSGGVPTWATPSAGGGGKVLQVVQATYATSTATNSTSFTDTGLSGTITPSSSSSKIMVLVTQPFNLQTLTSSTNVGMGFRILRGATAIVSQPVNSAAYYDYGSPAYIVNRATIALNYLDSPATTSATTYKTQGCLNDTASSRTLSYQPESSNAVMLLLEIGA
jgi:hypothetical protein